MNEVDDYIPAREAADSLGIKYNTLMARVNRGQVTHKKIGWAVIIHKDEVERIRRAIADKNMEDAAR